MTITRHNYEDFFLLYLDNELSTSQREMVEDFIRQNPDLESEWNALQQTKLKPEKSLMFPAKQSLLQIAAADQFIHFANYTECFILYADEELTAAQKTAVEQFVYNHPQLQQEFELMQEAKMIPDARLVFPDRETLYRYEETRKPAILAWWRPAVAAAVVILAGLFWLNRPLSPDRDVRVATLPKVSSESKDILTEKATDAMQAETPQKANLRSGANIAEKLVQPEPVLNKGPEKATPLAARDVVKPKTNAAIVEPVASDKKHDNVKEDQIARAIPASDPAIDTDPSIPERLPAAIEHRTMIIDQASPAAESQSDARDALLTSTEEKSADVIFANIPINKKASLRGFFRKASRYIDKTTARSSGERSGILIGNIKIAFQ